MTDPDPRLAAARDRLAQAFERLEKALENVSNVQSTYAALKAERDRFKREALEEAEKLKSLQGAAFNISTRLNDSIKRIDAILEA